MMIARPCISEPSTRDRAELAREGWQEPAPVRGLVTKERAKGDSPESPSVWTPGKVIGRYTLGRQLGRGGMAEVWMAWRAPPRGGKVALRRIRSDLRESDRFAAMFCDEAHVLALLAHPNIVRLVDFSDDGGEPFMALEYIDGFASSELLRMSVARGVQPPIGAALFVVRELLQGLAFVHEATDPEGRPLQIVHRDVSPGNVLVSRSGDVKLTDFGIMRCETFSERTAPGSLKGKLGYMSPEQVAGGELDRRSDLFAAGVVLAELLIARPLFSGLEELEILTRMYEAGPRQELSGVPRAVREAVLKALERDRAERYQSAAEFSAALEHATASEGIELDSTELVGWLERLGLLRVESGTFELSALRHPRVESEILQRIGTYRQAYAKDETVPPDRSTGSPLEEGRAFDGQPLATESDAQAFHQTRYALAIPGTDDVETGTLARLAGLAATGALEGAELFVGEARIDPEDVPALARLVRAPAFRFRDFAHDSVWRRSLDPEELPRVLLELIAGRETGLLAAKLGDRQTRVYFEKGEPSFVASTDPAELLGARLVRAGFLSRDRRERAVELACEQRYRLGEALVAMGAMKPAAVLRAVAAQLEARFIALGSFSSGELCFVPAAEPGIRALRPLRSPRELVTELVRAHRGESAARRLA